MDTTGQECIESGTALVTGGVQAGKLGLGVRAGKPGPRGRIRSISPHPSRPCNRPAQNVVLILDNGYPLHSLIVPCEDRVLVVYRVVHEDVQVRNAHLGVVLDADPPERVDPGLAPLRLRGLRS